MQCSFTMTVESTTLHTIDELLTITAKNFSHFRLSSFCFCFLFNLPYLLLYYSTFTQKSENVIINLLLLVVIDDDHFFLFSIFSIFYTLLTIMHILSFRTNAISQATKKKNILNSQFIVDLRILLFFFQMKRPSQFYFIFFCFFLFLI